MRSRIISDVFRKNNVQAGVLFAGSVIALGYTGNQIRKKEIGKNMSEFMDATQISAQLQNSSISEAQETLENEDENVKYLRRLIKAGKLSEQYACQLSQKDVYKLVRLSRLILADKLEVFACIRLSDEQVDKAVHLMPLLLAGKITSGAVKVKSKEEVQKLRHLTPVILVEKLAVSDVKDLCLDEAMKIGRLSKLIIAGKVRIDTVRNCSDEQAQKLYEKEDAILQGAYDVGRLLHVNNSMLYGLSLRSSSYSGLFFVRSRELASRHELPRQSCTANKI